MVDLQSKEFKEFFQHLSKTLKRDEFYTSALKYADRVAVHAYGEKPVEILERYRPREDEKIREYRLESYEPITKSKFDEALKVMKKMFNDSLFSITWPETSGNIKDKESLEQYITKDYPERGSLLGYLKEEGLKYVLSNPNGMFCVVPGRDVEQNEFKRPYLKFYKEDSVLYASDDFVMILLSGDIGKDGYYLIIDEYNYYYIKEEKKQTHKWAIIYESTHNLGEIPAWYAGGIVEGDMYKSFFDSALAFWNKAIAHDSDLDGVLVNHAFPHMWSVEIDCTNPDCHDGKVVNIKGEGTHESQTCTVCNGHGRILSKSPYDMFSVNQDTLNENPAIAPPAGYISPPTDIIKMLDDKVESLIQKGMEALKMHVVVGMNQSGKAKEWDRKELNESIQDVSELMYHVHFELGVHYINLIRYGVVIEDKEKLKAQEPVINSPKQFDILTVSDLTEELKASSESNINPNYQAALTKEISSKRFSADTATRDKINAIVDLDPFSGVSQEDKMVMLSDGTVTKLDIIVSNNIKSFVERALEENADFYDKTSIEKKEILDKYATEILTTSNQTTVDGFPADGQ